MIALAAIVVQAGVRGKAALGTAESAIRRGGCSVKSFIMGLPGAGKTTLANALAPLLNAVVFNADAVRANISRDLGFNHGDRVEHARRMGWMCDRVADAGGTVIADFICPTPETRAAFGDAFTIWIDRVGAGRFETRTECSWLPSVSICASVLNASLNIGLNRHWSCFDRLSIHRSRPPYSSGVINRFTLDTSA